MARQGSSKHRGQRPGKRRGGVVPAATTEAAATSGADTPGDGAGGSGDPDGRSLGRRHIRFGWLMLCVSLPAGLALEVLHGLKFEWYLGPDAELRRLLWTLAHAHGTLLAILNLVFGVLAAHLGLAGGLAPRMLMVGAILLPVGFFGGGVVTYGGDPGPTIALAPIGGLLLVAAVLLLAGQILRATRD